MARSCRRRRLRRKRRWRSGVRVDVVVGGDGRECGDGVAGDHRSGGVPLQGAAHQLLRAYDKGDKHRGERVLVVGCGNSGIEVALDICGNDAKQAPLLL
ncbi:hypothetical protein ZIOFF_038740 [Zingiber officinale]|uniref:Flavin-containing monooxygenase n=1 Tax=Zingiber officinale TaxID=94328 RepID=A0A8J5KWM1_ZINOF|nr:hypothetical protein ZIOFF_038740 [Zingiber officinale]